MGDCVLTGGGLGQYGYESGMGGISSVWYLWGLLYGYDRTFILGV